MDAQWGRPPRAHDQRPGELWPAGVGVVTVLVSVAGCWQGRWRLEGEELLVLLCAAVAGAAALRSLLAGEAGAMDRAWWGLACLLGLPTLLVVLGAGAGTGAALVLVCCGHALGHPGLPLGDVAEEVLVPTGAPDCGPEHREARYWVGTRAGRDRWRRAHERAAGVWAGCLGLGAVGAAAALLGRAPDPVASSAGALSASVLAAVCWADAARHRLRVVRAFLVPVGMVLSTLGIWAGGHPLGDGARGWLGSGVVVLGMLLAWASRWDRRWFDLWWAPREGAGWPMVVVTVAAVVAAGGAGGWQSLW